MKYLSTSAIFCAVFLFPTMSIAATDAEVERLLKDAIKQISSELPVKNAGSTVVQVFAGPGRRVTYINVWDGAPLQWTIEMKANGKRAAISQYCIGPTMSGFREYLVTVSTQHRDRNGKHIMTNTVTPEDCRR
jgi:hypothetical protein